MSTLKFLTKTFLFNQQDVYFSEFAKYPHTQRNKDAEFQQEHYQNKT